LQHRHSRGTDRSSHHCRSAKPSIGTLTAGIVPELVHKVDTIADVAAVLPDAVETMILDGGPLVWRVLFHGNMRLDNGPFLAPIFKWPEHAILVFGLNVMNLAQPQRQADPGAPRVVARRNSNTQLGSVESK